MSSSGILIAWCHETWGRMNTFYSSPFSRSDGTARINARSAITSWKTVTYWLHLPVEPRISEGQECSIISQIPSKCHHSYHLHFLEIHLKKACLRFMNYFTEVCVCHIFCMHMPRNFFVKHFLTWPTIWWLESQFKLHVITSAESQKDAIADQRCSVENQKGAIAIDSVLR